MSHLLSQLGENAILQRILPGLPENAALLVGPGDDCAVVSRDEYWDTLLKTDVVVEGVHFTPDTPPPLIGRKALARALSDIAAMGGLPEHALITILIHPSRTLELLEGVYTGICSLAAQFGVSIAGGETSSLPYDGLVINVALTGKVEKNRAILRSGGAPGDILCVSGPLGGSFPSGRHLSFTPRIELSRALVQSPVRVKAMMDLSDGLGTDLPRLAKACGCSFEIDLASIPCHTGCSVQQAISDGEDYELLMAIDTHTCSAELCAQFGITPIGQLVSGRGTSLPEGWQHFNA